MIELIIITFIEDIPTSNPDNNLNGVSVKNI